MANGELVEQRSVPDWDTWVWEQREPMATYLTQVLTGDYAILDGGVVGNIPIVNVALAGDVERMAPYFELTDDLVAFFEPMFGPYPLDRYGLAFTESFSGLAMETQGASMFSRTTSPAASGRDRACVPRPRTRPPVVWRRCNTCRLGRPVAQRVVRQLRAQWLWLDHVGLVPLETLAQRTLTLRQDFVESTAEPTVENLFGFERYDGGAVVLHALRQEIGDESFFTLLQRWVAENDGTSKRTADFTALAAEVAGRDHGVLRNVAVRRGRARRISRITPRRRAGTPAGRRAPSSEGEAKKRQVARRRRRSRCAEVDQGSRRPPEP